MQTLQGVRFFPILRVHGTLLGLDARWLGVRGLGMLALLTLLSPAQADASTGGAEPPLGQLMLGLSMLAGIVFTSLGHELGHAVAGRLAGLQVRAVVLAPEGGVTIRSSSDRPHVNLRTALAGPLANGLLASSFALLGVCVAPGSFAAMYLAQMGMLQLFTGLANLLPLGPMDGSKIVQAWRACQAAR